ncbi:MULTISPECIES: hypothetical protein [Acinetobacter calcoaceticus/baumannii complex]|uniref:hypothetical protein n=1 Tax=Acinetobacter calcoaceticus/baumannii complex TaxID=909768 RepID=UPI0004529487|nr:MULTISPECIES: hypothetical protein [Acinetobacter calcoaceticus/baumannii complex]EXR42457.1 hypothetical protein J655_1851 [Acinetobacter sp. 1294243]OCY17422.1 hypothetical protein BFR62_15485 [Acinetobacter pittii]
MKKLLRKLTLLSTLLFMSNLSFADIFNFEKIDINQITLNEIMKNVYKMKNGEYQISNKPNQVLVKGSPQVLLTMRPTTEYQNIQGKIRYEVVLEIDELVNGKPKKYEEYAQNVDAFTFAKDIDQGKYTLVGMSLQSSVCTFKDN